MSEEHRELLEKSQQFQYENSIPPEYKKVETAGSAKFQPEHVC